MLLIVSVHIYLSQHHIQKPATVTESVNIVSIAF